MDDVLADVLNMSLISPQVASYPPCLIKRSFARSDLDPASEHNWHFSTQHVFWYISRTLLHVGELTWIFSLTKSWSRLPQLVAWFWKSIVVPAWSVSWLSHILHTRSLSSSLEEASLLLLEPAGAGGGVSLPSHCVWAKHSYPSGQSFLSPLGQNCWTPQVVSACAQLLW